MMGTLSSSASSAIATPAAAAAPVAPDDDDTSSLELLIKWFPLSTVLVVVIALLMGKSDHVTAWWGIMASYLDVTKTQLGVLVMSLLIVFVPGSIALRSVLRQNRPSVVLNSETHHLEKAALLKFFEATNGVGDARTWTDRTNWDSDLPLAKWKGVFVHPQTKRVCKLILPENGLSGQLPSELFTSLTALTEIDLRDNQLTGPLPVEICSLAHLEGLYLYDNMLTGDIPLGFSEPPLKNKLTGLFLFNNRFDNVYAARKLFQETLREECYIYV